MNPSPLYFKCTYSLQMDGMGLLQHFANADGPISNLIRQDPKLKHLLWAISFRIRVRDLSFRISLRDIALRGMINK